MLAVKFAIVAASTVGWGVLVARGVDRIRADVIYSTAFRDGYEAGSAV